MADPLKEILALKERMNRLLENAVARSNFREDTAPLGEWAPAVDVFETREHLVLQAELPGLTQHGIDITITDRSLSIRGERPMAKEVRDGTYHRIERSYGSFDIDVPLQAPVAPDRAQARFQHGVLEVRLPKVGPGRARPVKVRLN